MSVAGKGFPGGSRRSVQTNEVQPGGDGDEVGTISRRWDATRQCAVVPSLPGSPRTDGYE
jgi:Ser/Thr protein kinase RdoA (MazF antagonist)